MRGIALGLIAGAGAVLLPPPSPWLLPAILPVALLAVCHARWRTGGLAFLCGIVLAGGALQARLEQRLSPTLDGRDLVIEGRITGLPERDARRLRFELRPLRGHLDGATVRLPDRVRLSWYERDGARVEPGEVWRFAVRLRVPRGFANPGGFDYAGWLLRRGIGATGYVRADPSPRRLAAAGHSIDRLRADLRARLAPLLQDRAHGGILLALTLGDRSAIAPAAWRTLLLTGTNHLMAISGLHIGLVAGLGFLLGGGLWRCSGPLRQRLPRPLLQCGLALLGACAYAALAGFALPTTRALAMLVITLGAVCLRRRVRPSAVLASAAVLVVGANPLAVLEPGFWLSFGAVAAIVVVAAGRLGRPNRLGGWTRLQLAISLALLPLLLGLFQQSAVIAPLANLLAVPWVSILTVPNALAGVVLAPVSPAAAAGLLALADQSLATLWPLLEWLQALPFAHWRTPIFPPPLLALAALGAGLLLLPRGVPGRLAGLIALMPLLAWQPPRPDHGGVWLDLLDVGQGLAVVVRTAGHTLLYDAGPRFSERFDTGTAVVNPFLQANGVGRLDGLVISHGDNDHAGGIAAVRARFAPHRSWSSIPHRTVAPDRYCAPGLAWQWDGVRFAFLHPARDGGWHGNNGSCVLRIDAPGGSVLLPGDIERPAERDLVRTGARLQADVVVAPHHGSATSSSPAFVRAVRPAWVLYSVGHRNRWGFPRPEVMSRWGRAGWARTDCGGALHLQIDARRGVLPPQAWRIVRPRRWDSGCAGSRKSGNMRAFEGPAAGTRMGRPGGADRP